MTIRVLQLGRLLVSSATWEWTSEQVSRALLSARLSGKIYCVIICGGITADGAPANFEAAARFLDSLKSHLRDPGTLWKKRVLVVPGATEYDVNSDSGRFAFKRFYDEYFDEIGDSYREDASNVRHLRDLTLIGANYRNGRNEAESRENFASLRKQVQQQDMASAGLEYIRQGPVILSSAESPLLDANLRHTHWDRSIRNVFHGIDLNLYGAGAVGFLPSEPFCFAPVSIGLGPRAEMDPAGAAVHMNSIEFQRPTVPRPGSDQPSHLRFDLKINCVSLRPPVPESWTFSYLTPKPQSVASAEERLLHQRFVDNLSEHLQRSYFVSVLGYGDVWRQIVAKGLRSRKEIGGNQVEIRTIGPLTSYPSGKASSWRAEQLSVYRDLDAFRGRTRGRSEGGGTVRVAVLADEAFSTTEHNRRDAYEAVRRELAKLCTREFRILYLVSAWDIPASSSPLPNTSTLRLEPLDPESFERLIELFSLNVPVDQRVIGRLSSGYLGFVHLLFQEASNHFGDWEIERDPGREACLLLVEHALEYSDLLREEKDRFFDFMREQPSGVSISNFIFERLKAAPSLRQQIQVPVEFSYEQLRKAGINPADVSALEETGVVKDIGGRFELQERVPFLTEIAQPNKPGKIFISYAQPDRGKAEQLSEALRRAGIDVWEFSRASNIQKKLPDEIMDRLRDSAAVVVIWTKEAVKSRYVIREAREAAKSNKPRLINWFAEVSPPSVRDARTSERPKTEADRVHRVLAEFKDFQGKEDMRDVVGILMQELNPFALWAAQAVAKMPSLGGIPSPMEP